ncbi:hypothetical protein M2113_001022 [Aurantimicrobium minutum]|uniref:DUF262 domain-containing protein n=1 Tax=Aurantimicrobium minutum TaxID=708131 RepID=UPI00247556C2|nr:DUF262 domain-containing protein [Aurantimicrobium minutum]MDH6410048.1 hypothetical protein [Aurantimicrobium minutum]
MSSHDFQVIDGTVRSVQEMFTGRSYSIEYYQREYSWGKQNIEELVQDLVRSFNSDYEPHHSRRDVASYRPYFLGPVVTFSKEATRFLVDGQQRMTSLSLLMIHISSLLEPGDSQSLLNNLVYSTQFGQTKFTIDVPERETVMSAIRNGAESSPDNLDQSSEVLWDRFQDIIQIFPLEFSGEILPYFVDWLLHRVVLVEIGTTDKDMALEIFESMNDRGLQLSNMDMLKSYLLSRIGEPEGIERANALWRANVQELKNIAKNGDSEFMKTLLRAKFAETVRDTKKSAGAKDFEEIATVFHKWLRDRAESFGLVKGEDFSRFVEVDVSYYSHRYKQLLDASTVLTPGLEYVYFNAHNDFTLQFMVIMAAIEVEDTDETFKRKANLIAAFIDLMITRRMAEYKNYGYSPMYRPMFILAKELRNKPLDEIRELLKLRASELPEQLSSLANLRLTKTNKPEIYYLLARITSWLESETTSKYFERRRNDPFEVEHIWANKYERHLEEFNNEFEFADHRNSFGDLLLLPKSFNASYGALAFSEKVELYFSQNGLAQSLCSKAYANNPKFLSKVQQYSLPFKAYEGNAFTKEAINARQELYSKIAEIIWAETVLDSL